MITSSWIIRWIDVIDASGTNVLDLENALLISCPGIMSVPCRIHPQRAGLKQFAVLLESFTVTTSDLSTYDRHNFGVGMSMGRLLKIRRKFDA